MFIIKFSELNEKPNKINEMLEEEGEKKFH